MQRNATRALHQQLLDDHPQDHEILSEVLDGLGQTQKTLPSKYFYDARGCELFEAICQLPEYYLTRTELAIMRAHASEMAMLLGRRVLLIEFGSGASIKTRLLLDRLREPAGYVPVDISRSYLTDARAELASAYPALPVLPLCADFTQPLRLPNPEGKVDRRVCYLPGSTLGNFEPAAARQILKQIAEMTGAGGGLLIGLDLHKEKSVLEAAYNDRAGVTAAFNLNLLHRLNREHDADFDVDAFSHGAHFNEAEGRIEMHLLSEVEQQVSIGGETLHFAQGETIHTENSYKYHLAEFSGWASECGMSVVQRWTDDRQRFAVLYLQTEADPVND